MDRARSLAAMAGERLDLVVIGGGITGCGIALDAAARGLKVALLERNDLASGTSSKTSKLIHGGLRYLKQLQFKVTIESSREKSLLQTRLAPHLVEDTPFLLPLYGGPVRRRVVGAGLWLYDLAAGLKRGQTHRKISSREALDALPGLDASRLSGAYVYHDARADDCRLVLHVARKASELGALVATRVAVRGFVYEGRRIAGVHAFDAVGARAFTVAAKRVVNAAGVWCDAVRALEAGRAEPVVRPSKGVHLVVPRRRIGNRDAAILQSERDGRVVFVVPWGERSIVGTTDTDYQGDVDSVRAEEADVTYLLEVLNEHLPSARVGRPDIISTYAGLRPLLLGGADSPSRATREHHLFESPSGLITITGGKLTTYRAMARKVVDRAAPGTRCRTHLIELYASKAPPEGLPADMAAHLHRAYGSVAHEVARRHDASERLVDGLPCSLAEVDHAVESEMALTVGDVLARRTRIVLYDEDQGRAIAERVARRMAGRLGWDESEVRRQIGAYEEDLRSYPRFPRD